MCYKHNKNSILQRVRESRSPISEVAFQLTITAENYGVRFKIAQDKSTRKFASTSIKRTILLERSILEKSNNRYLKCDASSLLWKLAIPNIIYSRGKS